MLQTWFFFFVFKEVAGGQFQANAVTVRGCFSQWKSKQLIKSKYPEPTFDICIFNHYPTNYFKKERKVKFPKNYELWISISAVTPWRRKDMGFLHGKKLSKLCELQEHFVIWSHWFFVLDIKLEHPNRNVEKIQCS